VVNSITVKNKYDKYWLFVVTLVFVLLGSFVIYISLDRVRNVNSCNVGGTTYTNGMVVDGYQDGFDCTCQSGQILCTKVAVKDEKPGIDKFERDNLKFSSQYQTSGTNESLNTSLLKTEFSSISVKNGTMDITLDQEQSCTADGRIPVQVGLYYISNSTLYITNIIRDDPLLYTQQCIVSVNYKISNWKKNVENLKIVYMAEEGTEQPASLCYYNNNIYANGDVYSSVESCNICKCSDGISKCSNDRVCTDASLKK
jgi:hypothetical protein